MELTGAAKVTKCNHYFHGKCLRKWLYVQDSCPLCYGALYNDKEKKESRANIQPNHAQVIAHNDVNEGLIDHDHAMERPIDDGEENDSPNDTDQNDSEDSDAGNREDINELAEDTETSEGEDEESHEINEASWSCSDEDEDDLLYDSMDDCRRNMHSKGDPLSISISTFHQTRHVTDTVTTDQLPGGDTSLCCSKMDVEPSHLSDTGENSDQSLELRKVQNDQLLSVATNKDDDSLKQSNVNNGDTNS